VSRGSTSLQRSERGDQSRRGVLIVAYSYPPRGGVGSLRAVRLARQLPALGWRPVILTADSGGTSLECDARAGELPGVEVLRAPYVDRAARLGRRLGLRRQAAGNATTAGASVSGTRAAAPEDAPAPVRRSRLWLAARSLLLFPDDQAGWIEGAVRVGAERLARGDIAIVLSSSPPESAHVIASRLKARAGVPWIADFRDPWAFSHLREPSPLDRVHAWAEARTLRSADAIVAVTEGWSRRFSARYPDRRHRVIRNGFEATDAAAAATSGGVARTEDRFRVVYTGKLDLGQQDPSPLFQGIAAALADGAIPPQRLRVVFHCYGDTSARLRERAAAAGLGSVFEWGGPLDQAGSQRVQASADVLLLFAWGRDPDCVPAKLYDYLAAGRRILALGPRGEAARLRAEAGRGQWAGSAEECRRVLLAWYEDWSRAGELRADGDAASVAGFAFAGRAREMAALMDELASERR
jgi:hypothetical protein